MFMHCRMGVLAEGKDGAGLAGSPAKSPAVVVLPWLEPGSAITPGSLLLGSPGSEPAQAPPRYSSQYLAHSWCLASVGGASSAPGVGASLLGGPEDEALTGAVCGSYRRIPWRPAV